MLLAAMAATAAPAAPHKISPADFDTVEVWPHREPTMKEARDSGASLEEAKKMPWFPTHTTVCGGRPCRPGEGNLKGYRFWGQPYIHREEYVQSRHREPPHQPNPKAEYARLISIAKRVHKENVVIVAAGDWDWRRIILNYVQHAHRLGYTNTIILSMDSELHADLRSRNIPSFDNSDNVNAWNTTCLQRWIGQVRMERHFATFALVAGGFDVLLTDATVVFVRDFMPFLTGAQAPPPDRADMLTMRHNAPPPVMEHTGAGVNPGFLFVRAARRDLLLPFFTEVVRRGLVEFYHRWDNVIDHFGFTFLWNDNDLAAPTTQVANEMTLLTLRHPTKCKPSECLRAGFLPHEQFPRIGNWSRKAGGFEDVALIHHLADIRPHPGHRQRLDRYDEADFEGFETAMREAGLWLVDSSPDYRAPSHLRASRRRG